MKPAGAHGVVRDDKPPALPDGLQTDDRTGLPVPWSAANTRAGRPDFTRVDAGKARQAGEERLCGVCGQQLGYWVAFLGTPATVAGGAFHDPPMHPDCARSSLRLCPHIAQGNAVVRADGGGRRIPQGWALWITRQWKTVLVDGRVAFLPAPAKTVERYGYDGDRRLVRA